MILTILGVILLMSLFCIGVFISMQDGMILGWLREPVLANIEAIKETNKIKRDMVALEYSRNKIKAEKITDEVSRNNAFDNARKLYKEELEQIDGCEGIELMPMFWLKPFVLCVYCFASFWGSLVFWLFHWFYLKDVNYTLIPLWIISVFICVVFNAVFDSVMRKLNVYE